MAIHSSQFMRERVAPAPGGLGWMARTRSYRRHQSTRHMSRRLKEDRNQHYRDTTCPCWTDPKAMARFREQPQACSCPGCGNQRRYEGDSVQERRAKQEAL